MGTHEEWMRRIERQEQIEDETVFCARCGEEIGHVSEWADDETGFVRSNVFDDTLCAACEREDEEEEEEDDDDPTTTHQGG